MWIFRGQLASQIMCTVELCALCDTECVVECVDDALNQEVSEEVVDPNCGLHMSCTSSFANFATYTDQLDHGLRCSQF